FNGAASVAGAAAPILSRGLAMEGFGELQSRHGLADAVRAVKEKSGGEPLPGQQSFEQLNGVSLAADPFEAHIRWLVRSARSTRSSASCRTSWMPRLALIKKALGSRRTNRR